MMLKQVEAWQCWPRIGTALGLKAITGPAATWFLLAEEAAWVGRIFRSWRDACAPQKRPHCCSCSSHLPPSQLYEALRRNAQEHAAWCAARGTSAARVEAVWAGVVAEAGGAGAAADFTLFPRCLLQNRGITLRAMGNWRLPVKLRPAMAGSCLPACRDNRGVCCSFGASVERRVLEQGCVRRCFPAWHCRGV